MKQDRAFQQVKDALANSVSLSFPLEGYSMFLFTDCSDKYCSAILLQSPEDTTKDLVTERPYEPLGLLSGSFKGSVGYWSVPEKKVFAIVEEMTQLD